MCCGREPWQDDLPDLLAKVGMVVASLLDDNQEALYKGDRFIIKENEGFYEKETGQAQSKIVESMKS